MPSPPLAHVIVSSLRRPFSAIRGLGHSPQLTALRPTRPGGGAASESAASAASRCSRNLPCTRNVAWGVASGAASRSAAAIPLAQPSLSPPTPPRCKVLVEPSRIPGRVVERRFSHERAPPSDRDQLAHERGMRSVLTRAAPIAVHLIGGKRVPPGSHFAADAGLVDCHAACRCASSRRQRRPAFCNFECAMGLVFTYPAPCHS